ncbi:CoA transferase [Pseudonocardia nematodicida]|uniref:CoA transferase n=1 Tax=Pseudonocardia nematodicida TaxID=1206997 RepID=A0ABV1K7R6_9PSEU
MSGTGIRHDELPLSGLRIIDLTEGDAESCARYLADLGADVLRIEPPGGSESRSDRIGFALRNANKRGAELDLDTADGADALLALAGEADILLESFTHARAESLGLTPERFGAAHPQLVVVSITDFGRTGPYRDRVADEDVLAATGGVLCRSGQPGGVPLLPPAGIVGQIVGVHAAWAALVAYVKRLRTGVGEHVDVSAFESVVHGVDPAFGAQGSAAAGRAETFPTDRPDAAAFYPVFPCADGHVRLCLLATRQWRAMFAWLGEPAEFADPRFDAIPARFAAADRLHPLIAALFAGRTRDELVAEGAARGIPLGGMLSPDEVLAAEHFRETGSLVEAELGEGLRARVPSGYVTVDGVRAGLRTPAPAPGGRGTGFGAAPAQDLGLPELGAGAGPLAGLRVLDLGIIVFGAELGRLFADQGADVVKVENNAYPDGLRQTRRGGGMNPSFAWAQRNKRGLGLDLRSSEGAQLFREMAAASDIVLANFKPGTLASLGFSHAELAAVNPRIIVSDSSAFGSRGPWRRRMGYGPLVRASCGISHLWRDPAADPGDPAAFCDGSTVYPDHVAGHATAVAVLAAVIGRARTGRGAAIDSAQADAALVALGPTLARASLRPGEVTAEGNTRRDRAPAGVFRCAGQDQWCVVSVRTDDQWRRLVAATGLPEDPSLDATPGRRERRAEIEAALAEWTATRTPGEVTGILQAAGVPAAAMLRLPDELTDPQLVARGAFRTLEHPQLSAPVPTNARIARFSSVPDPQLRPAPMPGEHTRRICAELLGLSGPAIDDLVTAGVLQVPDRVPAER